MVAKPANSMNQSSAAGIVTWDGTATESTVTYGNNGVLITSSSGVPSFLADGTTGQVLTATTGSPPSWTTITAGGGLTSTGNITWSNAALKAGTSLLMVAAPGANIVVVPVSLIVKFVYGGTNAFTNSPTYGLNYGSVYGTTSIWTNMLGNGNTFFENTANAYSVNSQTGNYAFINNVLASAVENTAVYLTLTGATGLTGNAAGNNTAVAQLVYYTINL